MSDKPTHWDWMKAAREIRDSAPSRQARVRCPPSWLPSWVPRKVTTRSTTGPTKRCNGASASCTARAGTSSGAI